MRCWWGKACEGKSQGACSVGWKPGIEKKAGDQGVTKSRCASLEIVTHSHLWRAQNPPKFFCHRLQPSMTRATVEDRTAGLGQNPPYWTSSGCMVIFLWRLGAVHEFTGTRAARRTSGSEHEKGGRYRLGSLALEVGQLPVIHTHYVAISVVSSVASTKSTAQPRLWLEEIQVAEGLHVAQHSRCVAVLFRHPRTRGT